MRPVEEELLISILTPLLAKLGVAATGPIVDLLVRRFGRDVVQGHLDQFELARALADAAESAKFPAAP